LSSFESRFCLPVRYSMTTKSWYTDVKRIFLRISSILYPYHVSHIDKSEGHQLSGINNREFVHRDRSRPTDQILILR
jgi:hypothetical protein